MNLSCAVSVILAVVISLVAGLTMPSLASDLFAIAVMPLKNASMAYSVALVDDDDRRTLADFVREHPAYSFDELRRIFRAVGVVRCPWQIDTAAVTLSTDLIIFPKNLLFEADGSKKGPINDCTFEIMQEDGILIGVRILEYTLITAPVVENYNSLYEYQWTVARLDRQVDVEPLSLVPARKSEVAPYAVNVIQVASGHDNWAGHDVDEFSISACQLKGLGPLRPNGVRQVRSNCDIGHKASGGIFGQLMRNASGRLTFQAMGMVVASSGVFDARGPFDVQQKWTAGITLEGDFREAIEELSRKE